VNEPDETVRRRQRRLELAQFLRVRRERLTPEEAGIESHRRRRTPGLRREEVAFLADIGAKWYARLEMADEVNPSATTLLGIAGALKLSAAETGYLFRLAGLSAPDYSSGNKESLPPALVYHVVSSSDCSAVLYDSQITPLYWNAVGDALFGYSGITSDLGRNPLVRAFSDPAYVEFLGVTFEPMLRRAVGMLRRHYADGAPSAAAQRVYDAVKDDPLFQRVWQERIVADEPTDDEPFERHHVKAGTLRLCAVNMYLNRRNDVYLRFLTPADAKSAKGIDLLATMGTASPID
jgi:transcriptional regulator with XRE-family HTH domain